MSFVVCPVLPFPNVYWWSFVSAAPSVLLDEKEHFEKMSFRNRYMVAGSAGAITLSIPIEEGRQQRKPMKEVLISNKTKWQQQHWRTLQSVYNRSPYFEFFAHEIETLFTQPFEHLSEFNLESIRVLSKLISLKQEWPLTAEYKKEYPGALADIRKDFRSNQYDQQPGLFKPYRQTFEERTGFLPNLSLLDLVFAEGKQLRPLLFTPDFALK